MASNPPPASPTPALPTCPTCPDLPNFAEQPYVETDRNRGHPAVASDYAVGAEGFSLFTTDFPPDEFAARRAVVYDKIGNKAMAVLRGEPSPAGYTRFRQSNEFYYLTGIEVPRAYVLLDGSTRRTSLYLPKRNARREASEGKSSRPTTPTKFSASAGSMQSSDRLARRASRWRVVAGRAPALHAFSPAESTAMSRDLAQRAITDRAADPFDAAPSREAQLVQTLRTRFPAFEIRDLSPTLDAMRLIKSPRERALITKATRLSGLALMEAMRSTEPGIYEYELDAMASTSSTVMAHRATRITR